MLSMTLYVFQVPFIDTIYYGRQGSAACDLQWQDSLSNY